MEFAAKAGEAKAFQGLLHTHVDSKFRFHYNPMWRDIQRANALSELSRYQ